MRSYQTSGGQNAGNQNNRAQSGRTTNRTTSAHSQFNRQNAAHRKSESGHNASHEEHVHDITSHQNNDPFVPRKTGSERLEKKSGLFEELTSNPSGLIKSLLDFIPPSIYNRETKKLFGILTAEDLLLAALILMLADSDDNDDIALLIALIYILLG